MTGSGELVQCTQVSSLSCLGSAGRLLRWSWAAWAGFHIRLHRQHWLPGSLLHATAPQENSPTLCGELHGHKKSLLSHLQLPRRQRIPPTMSFSLEPSGHSRDAKWHLKPSKCRKGTQQHHCRFLHLQPFQHALG